jgi:glycosyltransferase involved in cell wall biosynthesis
MSSSRIEYAEEQQYVIIRVDDEVREERGATQNSQSLVTVGVPVFNGEPFLRQSLESVLSQTAKNLLLLVSDNASSDGTHEVCKELVGKDKRVRYYRQKQNIGVFNNYNELARKCTTKYFKWQSSSDWCDAGFVEDCVDVLESDDSIVLACPQVLIVDESGKSVPYAEDFSLEMDDAAERFRYLLENTKLCNMFNGVIRANALQGSKLNREFLGSDVVLLTELILKGKFKLVPERLWHRRMTRTTASKLHSAEQRFSFFSGLPNSFEKYVTWKVLYSLFEIVVQSDVDFSTKISCCLYLVKKTIWVRGTLWREAIGRS